MLADWACRCAQGVRIGTVNDIPLRNANKGTKENPMTVNFQQRDKVTPNLQNAIVYVVDDDPQVRNSLRLIAHSIHLNAETYASAQSFQESFRSDVPSCLLLDVCLPKLNGIEFLEKLRAEGIYIPTIVMTAYGEVSLAVKAMKAGALDFIEKPYSRQKMVDLIQRALYQNSAQQDQLAETQEAQTRLATLSERETEIMELFFAGENTKRIASLLGISTKTVDYHRWNVLKKMKINNLVELAHYVATYAGDAQSSARLQQAKLPR